MLVAVVFLAVPAFGAVPASVAVREQLPAVEQIIQQLETKAAGAVGTWTTRSGRSDAPAQAWTTGIDGRRWYWRSDAAAPHPAAGMTLFNDGEDVCVLPYGVDLAQGGGGGIRFQYDTLRRFQVGDYLLGHYLLHMNLLPRQFIGALGGLSVVGEEELDGVKVVRLKSDPETDVVFKGDMAISHFYGAGKVSAMDLYYDPARRAIVKVVIGGGKGGGELELVVTGWDALGTGETGGGWPSKMVGRAVNASGGKASESGKAVLTSVEKYQSGKDSALEGVAKRVRDEVFFVTPYEGLRNASFYKKALGVQENASDRVALAQASFILCDVVEGVKQWDLVDAKLRTPRERERLVRALGELSAGMLEQAVEKKDQRQACVALIKRFNDDALSEEQFRKVSGGVMSAWVRLRGIEDTRVAVGAMNGTLLPKLVRLGSVFTIETLMKLADASGEDATLINPVFRQIMDMPVPVGVGGGDSGSSQHYLFLASIRQGNFERARSYLADLRWPPPQVPPHASSSAQQQIVTLWQKTLPVAESVKGGNERSLEAAIGFYVEFGNEENAKDGRNSTYGKWLLTEAGKELLLKRMKEGQGGGAENVIVGSAKYGGGTGSEAFWGTIVMAVAGGSVMDPNMLTQRVGPVLKAYGRIFEKPTFESEAWMRLAGSSEIRGKFLGVELSYLNKALVAAPDDAVRVKVILQIGNTYAAVREYEKGAAAVGALADMVTDEKQRSQIDKLTAALKARTPKGS